MSIDLQEPLDGIESARMALDEFRGTQEEYTTFFGAVFDDLQNLSLELFARHKCLEVTAEQKSGSEQTLEGVREEFHRSIEQLQELRSGLVAGQQETQQNWAEIRAGYEELQGKLQAGQQETQQNWTEIRAGYQRFVDDQAELRENVRQITGEYSGIKGEFLGIKEDVQRERQELHDLCMNVDSQLTRLSAVAAELAAAQAQPANDPQIAEVLEHARRQQSDWIEQRAGLEAELEAARRRAAEQTEALHEQKRLADQQQAELAGELKRMRSLMEALAGQLRGEPVMAGQSPKSPRVDNAVLGSVLAEFEMLHRDGPFRRPKRNNDANPDGSMFTGS